MRPPPPTPPKMQSLQPAVCIKGPQSASKYLRNTPSRHREPLSENLADGTDVPVVASGRIVTGAVWESRLALE